MKLAQVLDYILKGTTIKHPQTGSAPVALQETVRNAFDDGYFATNANLEVIKSAFRTIRETPIKGTSLPVAELINMEHLYWGDCSHEAFPASELHAQFKKLATQGLTLEFYARFDPTNKKYHLAAHPYEAMRINNLLARCGELTISQLHSLHPWDVRLIEHVPHVQ